LTSPTTHKPQKLNSKGFVSFIIRFSTSVVAPQQDKTPLLSILKQLLGMREVVVALVFCTTVATTIRVKKLRGAPEKLLLLMLLQQSFAHKLVASFKVKNYKQSVNFHGQTGPLNHLILYG